MTSSVYCSKRDSKLVVAVCNRSKLGKGASAGKYSKLPTTSNDAEYVNLTTP
jgi:hypothetical protein